MAAISGILGSVTYAAGYTTNVHRWEMELLGESLEITTFASAVAAANYRSRLTGLLDWRGSYECYIDAVGIVPEAGTTGAATFVADAPRQYSGTINVTSVRAGVSVDGSQRTLTVSFDGSGQATPA